jgi:MFS family permease
MENSSLRFRRGIYIAASIGLFDFGSVAVLPPTVAYYKNVEPGHASWILLWYAVAFIAAGLLAAQTGDKRGLRSLHTIGYMIYMAGALFCALPANLLFLIIGRCIQGVGMSMVVVTSMGYVFRLSSSEERHRIGTASAAYGMLAFSLGVFMSLALVKILPLHGVFMVQIVISAIALALALEGFESDAVPTWERVPLGLDVGGALYLILALVTMFFGIYFASVMGFFSRTAIVCFSFALIMVVSLAVNAHRRSRSILGSVGTQSFCSICIGIGALLASAAITTLTLTMAHIALADISVLPAMKSMSVYLLTGIVISFMLRIPPLIRIVSGVSKFGMLMFGIACFCLILPMNSFETTWYMIMQAVAGVGASLFLLYSLSPQEQSPQDPGDIRTGSFIWQMLGIAVGTILLTFMPLIVSIAGTLVQWRDQTAALTWTSGGVTLLLSISGFMSITAWILIGLSNRR